MAEEPGCGAAGPKGYGPCVRHVEVAVSEPGEDGRLERVKSHVFERQGFWSKAGKWVLQRRIS